MEYSQVVNFFIVFIGICTFVVLLGNVIRTVREWVAPASDVGARLDKHDELLAKDHQRLEELESSTRLMLRAVSQLIEHELTHNHEDQLREVRDDINTYLINR